MYLKNLMHIKVKDQYLLKILSMLPSFSIYLESYVQEFDFWLRLSPP